MNFLGRPETELALAGGAWTAREIAHQPQVWTTIASDMTRARTALRDFLDPLFLLPDLRVVLTGAGTSAFVGECLAPALKRRTARRVEALATTDLVGSPGCWLEPELPTLLVSFARSGNSPESVAAVTLAEQALPHCHHLVVTCNAEGGLYRQARELRNAHVVLLPDATNDRGFAMTSSFTGMLLTAALAFDLLPPDGPSALSGWGMQVLDAGLPLATQLADSGFERVVYLGGGAFKGLAHEAALKLLELSDGKVVGMAETPLGFRHGPKTVVNDRTLVVMFLGNDPHARNYDLDLLRELHTDGVARRVVVLRTDAAIAGRESVGAEHVDGVVLEGASAASDLALCLPFAVFAQSFAFLQSLTLRLSPDTPNARGVVNRVVQGVSIYPWSPS